MPLTHDFKETIRARAQRDPKFRQALLLEAVESYLNGDLDTGKAVLRDYVNATVGFQALGERTDIPIKSLMRMLSPKGSPSAANLASILTALQRAEGVHFELSLRPRVLASRMTSLNSLLPQTMKDFVESQVDAGGFGTPRLLIREDQKRRAEEKLEALLLEGLNSGGPVEITPEYWERKRDQLIERQSRKTGDR